jgi:hypothetical protein
MVVSQTSTICPIGARVSLILSKYPTWCQSTFEPCHYDLTQPRVPILFDLSKWIIIADHTNHCCGLESLAPMEDVGLNLGT